jgi:hypothetical protein
LDRVDAVTCVVGGWGWPSEILLQCTLLVRRYRYRWPDRPARLGIPRGGRPVAKAGIAERHDRT